MPPAQLHPAAARSAPACYHYATDGRGAPQLRTPRRRRHNHEIFLTERPKIFQLGPWIILRCGRMSGAGAGKGRDHDTESWLTIGERRDLTGIRHSRWLQSRTGMITWTLDTSYYTPGFIMAGETCGFVPRPPSPKKMIRTAVTFFRSE